MKQRNFYNNVRNFNNQRSKQFGIGSELNVQNLTEFIESTYIFSERNRKLIMRFLILVISFLVLYLFVLFLNSALGGVNDNDIKYALLMAAFFSFFYSLIGSGGLIELNFRKKRFQMIKENSKPLEALLHQDIKVYKEKIREIGVERSIIFKNRDEFDDIQSKNEIYKLYRDTDNLDLIAEGKFNTLYCRVTDKKVKEYDKLLQELHKFIAKLEEQLSFFELIWG